MFVGRNATFAERAGENGVAGDKQALRGVAGAGADGEPSQARFRTDVRAGFGVWPVFCFAGLTLIFFPV
jgi:hypothetical protein